MSGGDRHRDEDPREREFASELVTRLHAMLRAARLYDPGNHAFQRCMSELRETLAGSEDEVAVLAMGDCFHVNGFRLAPRSAQLPLFRSLLDVFDEKGLGAIRFLAGASAGEIERFLGIVVAAHTAQQIEAIPDAVADAGVHHIVPVRLRDVRSSEAEPVAHEPGAPADSRARASESFWRAVRGTRSILIRAAGTGRPALGQARRLVQPVVDQITRDEFSILGLTALKQHDEYTYAHCVNVSVLSVGIGAVLGLPRPALARLGVAALLHDLGKLGIAPDVLNKPGRLESNEWDLIHRHPLEGVKMLARSPGFSTQVVDAMTVCFQHHMNLDGTGYPARHAPTPLAPASSVVAVADVFDALTAHRAYRHRPYTGREALGILLGKERGRYDEAVLWALVQAIGVYPPGTVLRTRSGHVVVSVSPNRRDVRRPVCRVLAKPGHAALDRRGAEWWEPMPANETVESVMSPEEHGLDLDGLMAA